MLHQRLQNRRGISLIEVLVVLAIIALLAGLFFMAAPRVQQSAANMQCSNNLRQICLGVINCADTYQGKLPPLAGPFPTKDSPGTVFFHILPYVEQTNVYNAAGGDGGAYSVWKGNTCGKVIKPYICPNDASGPENGLFQNWLATSSYAGNGLAFGDPNGNTLNGTGRFPASFTDGTSNTIMFTERYQVCNDTPCAWGYAGDSTWAPVFAFYSQGKFQSTPTAATCDPALAQSPHKSGIQIGMADGSSRLVANTISPQTWWYACTPAGGEVLGEDW